MDDQTPQAFAALRAISEPSRVRVIELLGQGECCVCDLGSALGLSPALASHHLKVLKASGLIRERRAGRWVHYSLDLEQMAHVKGLIDQLLTPGSRAAEPATNSECAIEAVPAQRPKETR
ncbi:MAG TPA: metalloregulator ArsR/SmtB family transcription factor [Candidatus Limnocylindrales bacterium]